VKADLLADIENLAGSLLSRYAWIWAGVASARDPEALFQIQKEGQTESIERLAERPANSATPINI
jgi:hypothetical protein